MRYRLWTCVLVGSALWAVLRYHKTVDTSGLRERGRTFPASRHWGPCARFPHEKRSNGEARFFSLSHLVKTSFAQATHAIALLQPYIYCLRLSLNCRRTWKIRWRSITQTSRTGQDRTGILSVA